ncbi:hypothetical protein AAHE18_18G131300 [Arachis hypogaea]
MFPLFLQAKLFPSQCLLYQLGLIFPLQQCMRTCLQFKKKVRCMKSTKTQYKGHNTARSHIFHIVSKSVDCYMPIRELTTTKYRIRMTIQMKIQGEKMTCSTEQKTRDSAMRVYLYQNKR